jgi:hypothetical protein
VVKPEKPVNVIGSAPLRNGITKMLSAGSWVPIIGSFALGLNLTATANSASFTQMPQHEFMLILDARVDEVAE